MPGIMHDLAQDHIATAVGRPRPDTEPVMVATGGQQGETRLSREVEAAGAQRPSTIRAMLMWAVIAWIVPTWLCVAIGIVGFYQFERERLSQSTISIARAIAAGIDRELTGKMAATQVVALSPHLRSDDYAAFHREASELVPVLLGTNLVLADATGQQLVNTLRPYGEPLPFRTDVGACAKSSRRASPPSPISSSEPYQDNPCFPSMFRWFAAALSDIRSRSAFPPGNSVNCCDNSAWRPVGSYRSSICQVALSPAPMLRNALSARRDRRSC